jgi:hypothetical protein
MTPFNVCAPRGVQEPNSFFAYEPVLRVLQAQSHQTCPLDKILANESEADTHLATRLDVPAYLLDRDHLDLSSLVDRATMEQLPSTERARCVDYSDGSDKT